MPYRRLVRARRLHVESLERRSLLTTFNVSTLVDESDGNFSSGDLSLREAIEQSNTAAGADTINFDTALNGTILLGGTQLTIDDDLTINGPNYQKLSVSGNSASRVFQVNSGHNVTIAGLGIFGGNTTSYGPAIFMIGSPTSTSRLTLNRLYIHDNTGLAGGGLYAFDTRVTILNSTIDHNFTGGAGGVYIGGSTTATAASPTVFVINSTITNNQADQDGGGIVFDRVAAVVRNSTITGNKADADGSGIGGIGGLEVDTFGPTFATLYNTIVAGNVRGAASSPNDMWGPDFPLGKAVESSSSNNLVGDVGSEGGLTHGASGNIVGTNGSGTIDINSVLDQVLRDNGGTTPTRALKSISPAIDAGNNAQAINQNGVVLGTDQRTGNFGRVFDGVDPDTVATVDIGAFETQPQTFTVTTLSDVVDDFYGPGQFSLREAIERANANPSPNDLINFAPNLTGEIVLGGTALNVSDGLVITGPGADRLSVSGNTQSPIMNVDGGTILALSGLTFRKGFAANNGGAMTLGDNANVNLFGMVFRENSAGNAGGAILSFGTLKVHTSTFNSNSAFSGGAIHANGPGSHDPAIPKTLIENSTFYNNSAIGSGGALLNFTNAMHLRNVTLVANRADSDNNSTTDRGGAIQSTINSFTSTTLFNSLLVGNYNGIQSLPDDIAGKNVEATSKANLIGDANSAGGLVDGTNGNIVGSGGTGTLVASTQVDVILRSNNGGQTPTIALVNGSLAIDRGNNAEAIGETLQPLVTDQRGNGRFRDANGDSVATVDIGAFEVDRPVVASFGGAVTFTEDAAPIPITSTATISDTDSPNFAVGRLVAQLTAGGLAEDTLAIRTAGNISTAGNTVLFAGVQIGIFSGGTGTTALTILFNDQATATKVQALLRNIVYSSSGDPPASASRTVQVLLNDGDGGVSVAVSKAINIVEANDAPVVSGISGSVVYSPGDPSIQLSATATVTDSDNADFDGGVLTVRISSGGELANHIEIGGTNFTVNGTQLIRQGTVIGTLIANAGNGFTKFEVTFNNNAVAAHIQQLIRALRFRTDSNAQTVLRVIDFTLTDGDGGTSQKVTRRVDVLQ